ncbi:MAG: hypothetical protein JW841_07500 [Deltaproteobacteria bacterium]|nr:hypothetical protein [Deltaproteobacteria bacterium]
MASDDSDDRPKRSWREIDQMREKSGHRRNERPTANPRLERTQAYRSYKTQLNKLFDGGGLPDVLKNKLAEKGIGNEAKRKKELASAISAANNSKQLQKTVSEYKESFSNLEDEEALATMLNSDNEKFVLAAIIDIDKLLSEGILKRGASLKARLKTAIMTLESPRIKEQAKELLDKL